MGKLWIYLLLLSACVAAITAQKDDNSYPEEWDYLDNIYDDILPDISEEKQAEAEKSAEINDDYQIEDNRSAPKDETEENNVAREETSIEHNNADIEVKKGSDLSAENKDEKLVLLDEVDENNPGLADKTNDDENKSNPKSQEVPANAKTLKEQVDDLIDNAFSRLKDIDDKTDVENPVATEILEETKQILKETNDKFDADEDTNNYDDEPTDTDNIENIEEDTVDKVYDDLNADLEKLMETWKKLNEDNVEPETNADDSIIPSQIPENEVKFSLSKEKVDELNDKNDAPAQKQNITDIPLSNDKTLNSEELDDIIDEAAEGNEYYEEEEEEKEEDDENGDDDEDENDDNDEATDEEFSNNDDTIDKIADEIKPQADDEDILTQGQPSKSTVESIESITAKYPMVHQTSEQTSSVLPMTDTTEKGINVTDLTPEQYDNLMRQFKLAHLEMFELTDDELGRNVAPIHMELSLDEARVFTSPNYPSPYPTNNIIDWIFTGDGMGIELNITDFFVNGALGDYLLIKPGGVDASGTDGIVISYQLVEPRRYRFLSVDQMFVRFEARPGMAFTRGFSFSAKMILPRVDLFDDYELPAEPKILEPTQTLTLFLGGNTLPEFRSSLEAFRHIIADMATMYINYNGIDIGRNTTLEVTQITRTAPCDVHWPDYEYCSKVTFGVPLVYDEEDDQEPRLSAEDLQAMWALYSIQDPFALRLNRIGVTEFTIPDVNAKITMWTALTAAVVVFMVLVALALWRYSCFENYTRMPTYSNRDSIYNEKQGLDLYPTPHQTLPPLYSENEYKWDDGKFDETARVDLGGFTNKSYARDMYDLESDEEVGIAPRDRNAGIAPNYKYEV